MCSRAAFQSCPVNVYLDDQTHRVRAARQGWSLVAAVSSNRRSCTLASQKPHSALYSTKETHAPPAHWVSHNYGQKGETFTIYLSEATYERDSLGYTGQYGLNNSCGNSREINKIIYLWVQEVYGKWSLIGKLFSKAWKLFRGTLLRDICCLLK